MAELTRVATGQVAKIFMKKTTSGFIASPGTWGNLVGSSKIIATGDLILDDDALVTKANSNYLGLTSGDVTFGDSPNLIAYPTWNTKSQKEIAGIQAPQSLVVPVVVNWANPLQKELRDADPDTRYDFVAAFVASASEATAVHIGVSLAAYEVTWSDGDVARASITLGKQTDETYVGQS